MAVSTASLLLIIRGKNEAAGAFSSAASGLRGIAVAAGAVAVAAGAVSSLKMAGNFQQSMLQTAALTGQTAASVGASTDQMSRGFTGVSAAVLQMATQIPVSAQNLADGLYYITSSGYDASNALKILTLSGKDAAIGHMDTKVAADALTTALHSYGLSADQAANFNDILLQTVNLGKAEFSDLASSIGTVLPVSKQLGVSFGDVGAALSVLTLNGLSARQATMDVRALMQQMTVNTAGGKLEQAKLGLDFSKAHIAQVGLPGIIDEIKKATAGPDQMTDLTKLFGNKAARGAILPLIMHSGELTKDSSLMPKSGDNSGAITNTAFATSMQGANAQLTQLNTTIGAVQTALGGMFLPTLVRVGQTIGTTVLVALRMLSAAIQLIEHPTAQFQLGLSNLGTAIRSLLPFVEVAVALIVAWRTAMLVTSLVMGGVALAQSIWTGVIVANNAVQVIGKGIVLAYQGVVWTLGVIIGTVRLAMMIWRATTIVLSTALVAAQSGAILLAGKTLLLGVAMGVVRVATIAWTIVQAALNLVISANPMGLLVLAIVGVVAALIYAYNHVSWFKGIVDVLWTAIKAYLTPAVWSITETIKLMGPVIVQAGGWLKTILGEAFSFVTSKISDFLTMLKNMLETMEKIPAVANLVGPALKALNNAQALVAQGPDALGKTGKNGKVTIPGTDTGPGGLPQLPSMPPWLTKLLGGGGSPAGLTAAQIATLKSTSGQGSGTAAADVISALRAQFTTDKTSGASKSTLSADIANLVSAEKEFKLGNPVRDAQMLKSQVAHMVAVKANTDATANANAQIKLLTAQYRASADPTTLAKLTALDKQKYISTGVDAALAAKLATADTTKLAAAASKVTSASVNVLGPALTPAQLPGWGDAIVSIGAVQQASAAEELRQLRAQNTALQQQVANDSRQITLLTQQNRTLAQIADHSSDTATHTKRTADVMTHPTRSPSGTLRNLSALVAGR